MNWHSIDIESHTEDPSWGDKTIAIISGCVVGIIKFFKAWVDHNHGIQEMIFEILDTVISVAVGAIVGGILAFIVRKICIWCFNKIFKTKTKDVESN